VQLSCLGVQADDWRLDACTSGLHIVAKPANRFSEHREFALVQDQGSWFCVRAV
jgi:hypothetical protein